MTLSVSEALNGYMVLFIDHSGVWHSVPFQKQDDGNKSADRLAKVLNEIGIPANKFIPNRQFD